MNFTETKITSYGSEDIFGNGSYPLDSILLETVVRYLALKKNGGKVENLAPIKTYCGAYSANTGTTGDAYVEQVVEAYDSNIFIFDGRRTNEPLTVAKEGYVSLSEGRIPVASILSAKASPTTIYVNKEAKKAVVFVKTPTPHWKRLFSSLFFLLVPWLYKDDYSDYDKQEEELFKAINKEDGETVTRIVDELCKNIDFTDFKTLAHLKDWGGNYRRDQIAHLKSSNDSLLNEINSGWRRINEYNLKIANNTELINSLMASANQDDPDELFKFFKSRGLKYYQSGSAGNGNGKFVDFSIVAGIENYDKDEFLTYFNKHSSYMHSSDVPEYVRKLFYGIFGEQRGTLRAEAMFRLTNFSSLTPRQNTWTGRYNAIPHPHLYYYACLGSNSGYILRFLQDGQWDMALDQAIQAVMNFNFGDHTVGSRIMKEMRHYMDVKCVIADNGKEMTPNEFLDYISQPEQEQTESNT